MNLRLNKCVCAIGLLCSVVSVIASGSSVDEYSLERGRRLIRLVGYSPVKSKIDIGWVSVTNRIEVNGRTYSVEDLSGNRFYWEQVSPRESQLRKCGVGICGVFESPQAAAEAAFSEMATRYTSGGTPEAIAPQLKVSYDEKSRVFRVYRTCDYIVQSGKFVVYICGTDDAQAIAETLYTNNVLKVKK